MPSTFPARILQDHNKPASGTPCNNCGLCCRVQACRLSEEFLHSSQAPCIALEYHDGRFLCGMMIRPSHYLGIPTHKESDDFLINGFKKLLGVGEGCSMDDTVTVVEA